METTTQEERDEREEKGDDLDRTNDSENDHDTDTETNKHRLDAMPSLDAKQQGEDHEQDDDTDTLKDYDSDDAISLGSASALLESDNQTDSQVESQSEETSGKERAKRRCNQWTPGSYASLHKGAGTSRSGISKNPKGNKINDPKTQTKVVKHFQEENRKLQLQLEKQTPASPNDNAEENRRKIRELEAEIDCLTKQVFENDEIEEQRKKQVKTTKKIEKELAEAKELEVQLQLEIDNLKVKIQELEDHNNRISQENQTLKTKLDENKREAKRLERTAQKATEDKATLEQVADEKTKRNIALESLNKDLKEKTEQQEQKIKDLQSRLRNKNTHQATKPRVILIGDSNCRDVHPHLMRWLDQSVESVWAPTVGNVREWLEANRHSITGTTIVMMAGTNDLKGSKDRQTVCSNHKQATNLITEAGANLIVVQLPPVYYPQIRAEQRNRDSEIINEILTERHGAKVAKTEKITLYRMQMRGDGLHLTNESAEIVAEEITQAIQNTVPPPQQDPSEERENIEITITNENATANQDAEPSETGISTSKTIAAKIIGRAGERVRKIKGIYNVDINTVETDEDSRTFIITGNQQNVSKAKKIIHDIILETQEKDNVRTETSQYTNARPEPPTKIPNRCRFFAQGNCTRKKCIFLHDQGPADISMHSESEQEQEREPTPQRTIRIDHQAQPSTSRETTKHVNKSKRHRTRTPSEEHTPPPRNSHQSRKSKDQERRDQRQKEPSRSSHQSPSPHHNRSKYPPPREHSPRRKTPPPRRQPSDSPPPSNYQPTRNHSPEPRYHQSSRKKSPPTNQRQQDRRHSPSTRRHQSSRRQTPEKRKQQQPRKSSPPRGRKQYDERYRDPHSPQRRASPDHHPEQSSRHRRERALTPPEEHYYHRKQSRSRSKYRNDDRRQKHRKDRSSSNSSRSVSPHRPYRREHSYDDRELKAALRTILDRTRYK